MRVLLVAAFALMSGCTNTAEVWKTTPQDEYVKVVPASTDEDVELALKDSGREYHCTVLYQSSYPNNKVCYARLTMADKQQNIRVKLLNTPEALAIDTARTVTVVGYVVLQSLAVSGYHN